MKSPRRIVFVLLLVAAASFLIPYEANESVIFSIVISPDGQRVATVGASWFTCCWSFVISKPDCLTIIQLDEAGAKPLTRVPLPSSYKGRVFDIDDSGRVALFDFEKSTVMLFAGGGFSKLWQFTDPLNDNEKIGVRFADDGEHIVLWRFNEVVLLNISKCDAIWKHKDEAYRELLGVVARDPQHVCIATREASSSDEARFHPKVEVWDAGANVCESDTDVSTETGYRQAYLSGFISPLHGRWSRAHAGAHSSNSDSMGSLNIAQKMDAVPIDGVPVEIAYALSENLALIARESLDPHPLREFLGTLDMESGAATWAKTPLQKDYRGHCGICVANRDGRVVVLSHQYIKRFAVWDIKSGLPVLRYEVRPGTRANTDLPSEQSQRSER